MECTITADIRDNLLTNIVNLDNNLNVYLKLDQSDVNTALITFIVPPCNDISKYSAEILIDIYKECIKFL